MKNKGKIEHPKVFISYAWGTQEHDEKVIALATSLKGDGVDVVFDKWQLKEGNNTYSFMEKTVLDESITNVLILTDPIYAKKANERAGGVGTETQIISSEVYNKVEQRKFIPVLFERDDKGDVCKPQYMKGLLHFDLSMPDSYDTEYQRMVRTLYGIDTYKEPDLGKPPAWLEDIPKVSYKSRVTSDYYRGMASDEMKKNKYSENLEDLNSQILKYEYTEKDAINSYLELLPFRDEFLLLVKSSEYVQDGYRKVAKFLEELMYGIRSQHNNYSRLKETMVHECFIYTIAYYLKKDEVDSLKYLLNKTFFTGRSSLNEEADSYNCFYCHNDVLDEAVCKRDNKRYYCGTAALWIENLNVEICNKDEFVSGDLLCHSASLIVKNYDRDWAWFPLTYVYNEDPYRSLFATVSRKLVSQEHLESMAFIMNYDSIDDFKTYYQDVEEMLREGKLRDYRYSGSFDSPRRFWDYTKTEEIGTRN